MKTTCPHCGAQIEYDAATTGSELTCPHCHYATRLPASPAAPPPLPSAPPAKPKKDRTVLIVVLVVAAGLFLLLFVVGILAAIAIPNFVKARHGAQRQACVANLRALDGAKSIWALEHKKQVTDVPTDNDLFGPDKYAKEKPVCPAGGTYSINAVGQKPTCTVAGHSF